MSWPIGCLRGAGSAVQTARQVDRGEPRYADQRKPRGIWPVSGEDDVDEVTGPQGPDALSVRPHEFLAVLSGRHGQVKPALLDQAVIAG